MDEFKILLTLDEINLILGYLSEQTFKNVSSVIQKITSQAQNQIEANKTSETKID